MPELAAQTLAILHEGSVGEARRCGKKLAGAVGFKGEDCDKIALVAVELATNLVKHAGGGRLVFTPMDIGGRIGLQIESIDQGPGIEDVERVVADGVSSAGSLGTGLGAVNRLMDDFEIESLRGHGARIVCRKWVRRYAASTRPCPLDIGAATRPRLANDANGDAFTIKHWAESALVGVIDGLGHGQSACRAAQSARQYVESHFDSPLGQIFRGVGRACHSTRGVVMALALFDWGTGRLVFASLGNIEVRVFPSSAPFRFRIRRGVIGLNAPSVTATEHPWTAQDVMVMHSDGLSTRWGWKDFPGIETKPAAVAARDLLRALGNDDDDATVVVIRSAAS
jgi:anti-sigma regulatory factor (Ser/Thr protein kinase)